MYHFIRLTKGIREDLQMWQLFRQEFNGYCYIQDLEWESSSNLHLDSAGGKSLECGAYLDGSWAFLRWSEHWDQIILSDITYLESVPMALAICIWKNKFQSKKIIFNCDNMAERKIAQKNSKYMLNYSFPCSAVEIWAHFDLY